MFKKALVITAFVLFTALLVYGAVNRTMARNTTETAQLAASQGNGRSQNNDPARDGTRQNRNSHEPLNQGGRAERQSLNEHEPLNQGAEAQARGRQSDSDRQQQEGTRGSGQGRQGDGWGQGSQTEGVEPSRPNGQGQGRQGQQAQPSGQNGQGQGQGQGNPAPSGNGRGQGSQSVEPIATTSLSGVIVQAPTAGVELILETSAGEVQIGTGPNYLAEIGFVLNTGAEVTVTGFWEDGEFKASAITLLEDGTTVALRDASGRPMWSGAARGGRGAGSVSAAGQGPRS